MRHRFLIGIDEAGRGPLAGPVSLAAVMVPADFNLFFFRGIKDSKQLNERERETWYEKILHFGGGLEWSASFSSHSIIDRKGITKAIFQALSRTLRMLPVDPEECRVLMDGGLKAPPEFIHQETLIRGDETVALIAAASIVAKVKRDRHMKSLARKFPQYGFDVHKGYGTDNHRQAIRSFGLSEIHRTTFCHL